MSYYGDIRLGDTIDIKFCTVGSSGAPTQLAGSPVISAYPGNSTTQLTAGITLSVDFDSVTGLNNVRVVASSGNGYATATNYELVITTGTVGGTSVVGYVVGSFSIEARSAVMPTTAARTLDVSSGGEAGVDWANVGSPTTTVGLSGTTIKTATDVETDTADIYSALIIRKGTAQAGGAGTITLDAGASSTNTFYFGLWIAIVGGTGAGQVKLIVGYDGTTKVAVVLGSWFVEPDATSVFVILPSASVDVGLWRQGIPNALTAGSRLDADAVAISGSTAAADAVEANIANLDAAVTTRATPVQVNAEVLDVLNVDTFAEPGQGAPAATTSLAAKIGYLFKAWRNKKTQTATEFDLYNDAGDTVDQKAAVSDNGTTFEAGEIGTGP